MRRREDFPGKVGRMEHANTSVTLLVPLLSIVIVLTILIARRRNLFIRRIEGLTAIDEAIGRTTEMGRPMVCSVGLGGLDVPTLQALSITTYIIRASARFNNRVIVPVADATFYPITEEAVREAYVAEGQAEQFNADNEIGRAHVLNSSHD